LISRGITRRIARGLVGSYPEAAIRQQVAWQPYRPPAKSPAGALVQAIRDAWPPPQAWVEAQEHAAAVARQAQEERRRREEDEARRREWEAKPPEERIAGRRRAGGALERGVLPRPGLVLVHGEGSDSTRPVG